MSKYALGLYPHIFRLLKPFAKLYFINRAKKEPEYALHWNERFNATYSQISPELLEEFRKNGTIHIHCASIGEVEMVKPLLLKLLLQSNSFQLQDTYRNCKFVLTVFTPTGRASGLKISQDFPDLLTVVYARLDYDKTCKNFVNTFRPVISIFTETELWPVFITNLKNFGTKLFLINARLNPNTIKRYLPNYTAVTNALNLFDCIGCQSEEHLNNILAVKFASCSNRLFAKNQSVFDVNKENKVQKISQENSYPTFLYENCIHAICGNLKFNKKVNTDLTYLHQFIQTSNQSSPCILLSSTYVNECNIILQTLKNLNSNGYKVPNIILAPRKLEDFDSVLTKYTQLGYKIIKFSSCINDYYQAFEKYILLLQELKKLISNKNSAKLTLTYMQAENLFKSMLTVTGLDSDKPTVLVVDTFGHLNDLYYLGTANFIGGTFNNIGGHDPIFPLAFSMPVACGGNYSKQYNVIKELKQLNAIWGCGERFKKWLKPSKKEREIQTTYVQKFIEMHINERGAYKTILKNKFDKTNEDTLFNLLSYDFQHNLKHMVSSLTLQSNAYRGFQYFCANQNALSNYLNFLKLSND